MSLSKSKIEYSESKTTDKIAAFVFMISLFVCLIVGVSTQRFFILMTPFIAYGLWAVLMKRVWTPQFKEVKPDKWFWSGKESVRVGIVFIIIGSIFSIALLLLFPYKEEPSASCDLLENSVEKDKCYYDVARTQESVSYCLLISNTSMRDECSYEQYLVYYKTKT